MKLEGKKVLIAGGTGFIGKRVLKKLASEGAICIVLTRQDLLNIDNIFYEKCDLADFDEKIFEYIKNKYETIDAAVYMAANIPTRGMKKENYYDALNSTLAPFVKFSEAISSYIKKIVYISSIDVVGNPKCIDYDEKIATNPFTPYAVAKLSGELYIKSIASKNNINLTILRFAQVYGSYEPLVRVIPILINAIKNNTEFSLYGNGFEKRKFLFVEDAAKSIICALKSDKIGTFNIAGKSTESITELIKITEKIFGKKLNLKQISIEANNFDNIPSILLANKILGFEPDYTLEDGIRSIYNEYV